MRPVLIVGAGTGGLSLAHSLRVAGIPYLVFDRSTPEELIENNAGGGLGLWGPALMALRVIDIEKHLLGSSRMLRYAGYRTVLDKQWLVKAKSKTGIKIDRFTSCITLHRYELQRALLENLPQETLLTGKELGKLRVKEDSVTATFTDGSEYTGDILVGADGIHSTVRRFVEPETRPEYSGYVYWRATTEHDQLTNVEAYEAWMPQRRFGVVPMQKPEIFWFGTNVEPEDKTPRARTVSPLEKQHIVNTLKPFEIFEHCSDVVKNTSPENILRTPIYDVWAKKWVHEGGRVVLTGDAAHAVAPNLAQGAMLAIQDSLQLAECIRQYHLHTTSTPLYTSSTSPPTTTTTTTTTTTSRTTPTLHHHMQQFEKQRRKPAWITRHGARWVAYIGHLSRVPAQLRDIFAFFIPPFLKIPIFDAAHRFFLGGSYTPPSLGQPLWCLLLGSTQFESLPAPLQLLLGHNGNLECKGTVTVKNGKGNDLLGNTIGAIARLPAVTKTTEGKQAYSVKIQRSTQHDSETWATVFGEHCVHTELQTRQGEHQVVRKGPFWFSKFLPLVFHLNVNPYRRQDKSETGFCVSLARLSFSLFGVTTIPLPRMLWPNVDAKFWAAPDAQQGDGYSFDICVKLFMKPVFWHAGDVQSITPSA